MERLAVEFIVRSSLVAFAVSSMLWALRIRRAAVQHAAWVCVIVTMLALPAWLAWGPKASLPVLPAQPASLVIDTAPIPVPDSMETPVSRTVPSRRDWVLLLLPIYLLGFSGLLLRLAIGTLRARRLTSADCVAPVTVGLLRPRVILPESAQEWTTDQLAAVLAHEREHVRRRDPLFQWLALFNRAVFWLHPLAWWLERRIAALAEEACDAAVIEQGHNAQAYSLCLLDLARTVQRSGARINAVAMAMPGVYLPQRIKRILAGVRVPKLSRARLACAAILCTIPAALFASGRIERLPPLLRLQRLPALAIPHPPELIAQVKAAPPPKLEFDVATVKPAGPFVPGSPLRQGGPGTSDPERMKFQSADMALLLVTAYGMPYTQILGPSWIDDDKYDIAAKVPRGATKEQAMVMLQNLLADRFNLVVHRETREMQAYELTVDKGRSKLKPYPGYSSALEGANGMIVWTRDHPLPPPGEISFSWGNGFRQMAASRATVGRLAAYLAVDLGRPVVDKTGLTGFYDYIFEYHPVPSPAGGLAPSPAQSGQDSSDLFTSLTEQLGLKLEAKTDPVDILVVDSGEKAPVEN